MDGNDYSLDGGKWGRVKKEQRKNGSRSWMQIYEKQWKPLCACESESERERVSVLHQGTLSMADREIPVVRYFFCNNKY